MFCPQCSQQQISAEVRFCSRCGFPLDGVAQLLSNGGVLAPQVEGGELGPPSPRLKGVRQGVMLWLLGILLLPLLIVMVEEFKIIPEGFALFTAVMCFVGGFVRMIYAMLLEDGPLRRKRLPASSARPSSARPNVVGRDVLDAGAARNMSALPPSQAVPANLYQPPRADTSEILLRPPSVTENTTKLLDEQGEQR